MTRVSWTGAWMVAWVTAWGGQAMGQQAPVSTPATVPAATDPARVAFESGMQALAERRYSDAAIALERSLMVRSGVPVVYYNLALAYRGLGRDQAAIEAFERYLHAPDASASPERLDAIRQETDGLRARLVRLTVSVDPPGTTLRVDDRPVGSPEGPLRFPPEHPLVLDPGHHSLLWTAPDHREVRWDEDFAPGMSAVRVVSLPWVQEGRLVIEPSVPTAVVSVNGARVSAGRYASGVMAPGTYEVDIRAQGYVPIHRRVDVGHSGVVRVDAFLEHTSLPGWVVPAAVAGSVVVAAGITAAILAVALAPTARPVVQGTFGTVTSAVQWGGP